MLRRGPRELVAVTAPGLVAALVCIIGISARSLWLDEGATVAVASQHGDALWQALAHEGGNMLLYDLVLHIWIAVAGQGELALRLPSVFAAALTAGFTAEIGRRLLADPLAALTAGLLAAVSIGTVFWGQDASGYAPMAAAATGAFLALVIILDSAPDRPPPPAAVVAYVVANVVAVYTGLDAVLLIPSQLAATLWVRRRRRTVIGALAVVAALCIPLLVLAINQGSGQRSWVPPLDLAGLGDAALVLLSAGLSPDFRVTPLTMVLALASAGLLAGALGLVVMAQRRRGDARLMLLPVLWVLVSALTGVLVSAVGVGVELDRSALLVVPAVALALSWLVWRSGADRLWALGGLVIVALLRVAVLIPTYGSSPEPWQAVVANVLANARHGDCIAFYPQDDRMAFGYYVRSDRDGIGRAPQPVLPGGRWAELSPEVDAYSVPGRVTMAAWVKGCPRLWLISAHAGSPAGTATARRDYDGLVDLERGLDHRFASFGAVRFGRAAVIDVRLYLR